MLLRAPGFTFAAVVTIGLGIGASTAIFTVVNAVLLRPLPYPEPHRLVYIKENYGTSGINPLVASREFYAWKRQTRTLSDLAGYISTTANLTGGGESERVICGSATASFFQLLGIQPLMGRRFLPGDDTPDAAPVAILSHALWQRRFGGDPSVVGRTLGLDSKTHTIVGVLPETFQIPDRYNMRQQGYDVWVPFARDETMPGFTIMRAIGRLGPGATLEAARAELDTILQPTVRKGRTKHVVLLKWHDEIAGGAKRPLLFFLSAVGLVFLIACVNVATLLLSRAAVREPEIAVRLALGATGSRILGQLLTESLLLSLCGGLLGLALAVSGTDVLVAVIAVNLPIVDPIRVDYRVVGFGAALTLLAGFVFGLTPALQASSLQLNRWLKERGAGGAIGRSRRLLDVLVVVEVALTMVVLIGATLVAKSYLQLRAIDPGYRSRGVLTAAVHLAPARYAAPRDQAAFFQQAIQRLADLPGVQSVSAVSSLPLGSYSGSVSTSIQGRPDAPVTVAMASVSPGYFRSLGIPLIRGRDLTDGDRDGSPGAVVVNQSFVRRYCRDDDCLGTRIESWIEKDGWMTVVGVVGDVRDDPEQPPSPTVYVSYLQAGEPAMYLVLYVTGDPTGIAAAVRRRIATVDNSQPAYDIMTLDERLADALAPHWANTRLLGAFGVVALALGCIGVYGVMSFAVSRRTHELGVRIALGAGRRQMLALVMRHGLILVVIGDACGLAAALALNRALASLVFQVATTDAVTYAAAAVLWTFVVLVACYIPARRATAVNPLLALRSE